jgi:hypothetical protein
MTEEELFQSKYSQPKRPFFVRDTSPNTEGPYQDGPLFEPSKPTDEEWRSTVDEITERASAVDATIPEITEVNIQNLKAALDEIEKITLAQEEATPHAEDATSHWAATQVSKNRRGTQAEKLGVSLKETVKIEFAYGDTIFIETRVPVSFASVAAEWVTQLVGHIKRSEK